MAEVARVPSETRSTEVSIDEKEVAPKGLISPINHIQDAPEAGTQLKDGLGKSENKILFEDDANKLEDETDIEVPLRQDGDQVDDSFVVFEKKDGDEYKYAHLRDSFFLQLEKLFKIQLEKCDYYKRVFEQQGDEITATKFSTYSLDTTKYLENLTNSNLGKEMLPKFRLETVEFHCSPVNIDIREKELQLTVKVTGFPKDKRSQVYIIAEFQFPYAGNETLTSSISRHIHYMRIEPKRMLSCSQPDPVQLDIIHATDILPVIDPIEECIYFDRPVSFFVDKGKSRTLKRKFKPIKLTFYQKRGLFRWDRKLGSIPIKIDSINDEVTLCSKSHIMDGRKQTEAVAEVQVKIREPLVDKSVRACQEKMVVLT